MLPWLEFWFNTTDNWSLGTTPFKALCGRDPPTVLKWKDDNCMVEEVNEQIWERNEMLQRLKSHLEQVQVVMKEPADKKRREAEFQVGDKVYLCMQPYKLKNLAKKQNEKFFLPSFMGPMRSYSKWERLPISSNYQKQQGCILLFMYPSSKNPI